MTGERVTTPLCTVDASCRRVIPRPATPQEDDRPGRGDPEPAKPPANREPPEPPGDRERTELPGDPELSEHLGDHERTEHHHPAAQPSATGQESPAPAAETVRALFTELAGASHGSPTWQTCRDELVRRHLPLVHFLVRRFRGRGEPLDDLVQVATIGLIKAVDRFDLGRGVEFSTYATPTILGEVKRHFRDRGWAIRVPRRLQEQLLAVSQATGVLFGQLSRSPTIAELAAYTGLTEEQVLETIESSHAYSTVSLDAELHPDRDGDQPPRHLPAGDAEAALENVEHRASLRPLLAQLDPRARHILVLRFFANMTQSEIAAEVGVSQMHVSRLLGRTLARLREGLVHQE